MAFIPSSDTNCRIGFTLEGGEYGDAINYKNY